MTGQSTTFDNYSPNVSMNHKALCIQATHTRSRKIEEWAFGIIEIDAVGQPALFEGDGHFQGKIRQIDLALEPGATDAYPARVNVLAEGFFATEPEKERGSNASAFRPGVSLCRIVRWIQVSVGSTTPRDSRTWNGM